MAARRLLIVMLVLLGISSVIAIIVPEPNRDDSSQEERTTGTTGDTGATGATGESDDPGESGDQTNDPKQITVSLDQENPTQIKHEAGSRLILTVESKQASEIEIESLGLIGFADRFAPAVFDVILPEDPGRYEISAPGEKPGAVIVATT